MKYIYTMIKEQKEQVEEHLSSSYEEKIRYQEERNSIKQEIIIIIMYLYSAQYLHILQDSKRYLTNPTVQVQPQLTSN